MLKNVFSTLIPSTCLLCETNGNHVICPACSQQFFSFRYRRCRCCALLLESDDALCGACLKNPTAFDSTTVVCDYVAPFDQLILTLKFADRLAVASAVAELMAKAVLASFNKQTLPDMLVAVPLSDQRLAQRGFNQSLEIAKPLAAKLARPLYPHLLHRVRETAAQARLHPDQRQKNMLRAFSINPADADKIGGRHIGVVDDVITTGATLQEVASCLKRHGAARVSNIVFARTPPH